MTESTVAEAAILHASPGRVRVHVPILSATNQAGIASFVRRLDGVRSVESNALTGNLIIRYAPGEIDPAKLLDSLRRAPAEEQSHDSSKSKRHHAHTPPPPHVMHERAVDGHRRRARITVRGLDRDPDLSRRVVERLQQRQGVTAKANPLTGRVLVEWDAHQEDVRNLLSDIADVELPDVPGEDRPSHPLDPAPLIQSATRTAGASLGLAIIGAQRIAGAAELSPSATGAAHAAGVIGLIQGFPATRNGLRGLLGRDLADLLFQGAAIATLALSNSLLGLTVTCAEGVRLLTEVVARRKAWRHYEERLGGAAHTEPGATIRLETGQRAPRAAKVIEGHGNAIDRDGLPIVVEPGGTIPAGARVYGGPFVLQLEGGRAFTPHPRPAPTSPTLYDQYQRIVGGASFIYAFLLSLISRSPARFLEGLLLVNPRTAVIGMEMAGLSAAAYTLRSGSTVVGSRKNNGIRRPDAVLLDGPRVLTDGVEPSGVVPLDPDWTGSQLFSVAAGVAVASNAPWGGAFRPSTASPSENGKFHVGVASADIDEVRYTLAPLNDDAIPAARPLHARGDRILALRQVGIDEPIGLISLRPRLAPGVAELVQTCKRHRVGLYLVPGGSPATAAAVARRAGVELLPHDRPLDEIRKRQSAGQRVALVADSAHCAEALVASDLAIGLSSGRSGRFAAHADLLAEDLGAVAAVVEAGARREVVTRDSVALSALANIAGAIWGFTGAPGVIRASRFVYITALVAIADGWIRLRGGRRLRSSMARLVDPNPERWGRLSPKQVMETLKVTSSGLTSDQAAMRRRPAPLATRRNAIVAATWDQIRSPLTGIMAAGAALSLLVGSPLDFALIAASIVINVIVGVWQERQAGQAAQVLARFGSANARVLRDGEIVSVPAAQVVPGDVLILAPGERVAGDARLIESNALEIDEAALTGESLPVPKSPNGGTDSTRIVLEGTDVTAGTAHALVFAVGQQTRMGATAAALSHEEIQQSPLGIRLSKLLKQFLPMAVGGGGIVVAAGAVRGLGFAGPVVSGATIALAAVPEGLPLLSGMGQTAVANRLGKRKALVRRLSSVEALGRVDVACTDKTGTITEGRLALSLVADADGAGVNPSRAGDLSPMLRDVLLTAALASPHPDAPDAGAHPTDMAVVHGAENSGITDELRMARDAEAPFDPKRGFHATVAGGRLCLKGAPEALASRCIRARGRAGDRPLDEDGRRQLLDRAQRLAEQGLRVLLVAEASEQKPGDPQELTALGFVGISDPLRPSVPDAVCRCHEAGVRIIMITGDHPATARAIAREAGLLADGREVLTSQELSELQNGELASRLENVAAIARATPLDKLRIIESLQSHGHTVAMTGDGVNDAPALRLADVGVAMGQSGTEVARQAADVVLADDDFATLVEALVEGRGFWRNMRRALGLLIGGNLGEMGLVVGAAIAGLAAPLNTRQILAMNLITDALPALAVATQPPEHRNLAGLAREGAHTLNGPLRREVLRRTIGTVVPSLASYITVLSTGNLPLARTVAFSSVIATQLAQTLDAGRADGALTRPVIGAVGGSAALLVAALTLPPLRSLLTLAPVTPFGWSLIALGALAGVGLGRLSYAITSDNGTTPKNALVPIDSRNGHRSTNEHRNGSALALPTLPPAPIMLPGH